MNDEQARLESALSAAKKRVDTSSGRGAQGAENAYGQAFQALVKAGYRQQIRHKHRAPKG